MRNSNVFIINTPLHLLISQSIIKKEKLNNCILLSVGIADIENSVYFEFSLWNSIKKINNVKLNNPLSVIKLHINIIRNIISNISKHCHLYWGNDYQFENQIIRNYLSTDKIILFDDGAASYVTPNKNSRLKKIFIRMFFLIYGLSYDINCDGLGRGKYDKRFHLIGTDSDSLRINIDTNSNKISKLREVINNKTYNIIGETVVFMTQPLTEYNVSSHDFENDLLIKSILFFNDNYQNIIIKSHPKESDKRRCERIEIFKNNFKGQVYAFKEIDNIPVELLAIIYSKKIHYSSLYSTALITIKLMDPESVTYSTMSEEAFMISSELCEVLELFNKLNIRIRRCQLGN